MPIYEYRCHACRRRFSALVGVVANPRPIACTHCGSAEATRLVSRFARVRSEDDILDNLADSAEMGNVDENDPASVARWMKHMGDEMGEDFGDDFEEALEEEMASGGEGEASMPADDL
jgi:putative FmdB family regulatory protein